MRRQGRRPSFSTPSPVRWGPGSWAGVSLSVGGQLSPCPVGARPSGRPLLWPGLCLCPCPRPDAPRPAAPRSGPGTGQPVGRRVLTGPPPLCPPLTPRCLCSPAAASPEFTHIHVKALLFVWGLGLRSAVSCCLWKVLKSRPARRPPPLWSHRGAEEAAGAIVGLQPGPPMRGSSSCLQPTEWETEAQRGKRPAGVPLLVSELGAAPTRAHTLTALRRDRNSGASEVGAGSCPTPPPKLV